MARFSLKSTLISVLFLIIFILTISQIKHEKNPKLDPKGPKNSDPKEALEMFESENESPIEKRIKNNILKAEQNQLKALTPEEFKKLPKPNEVIKIAHGPVVTKKNEIKLTVLQKFSQLLKTYQCSGQLQSTKV